MPTIKRFEDIEAWKTARLLTKAIYDATRTGDLARDFSLKDQMRRAAVSVMANIAEGFDRGGDAEFKQFLSIAKGSTSEVQSHLYVALDGGLLPQEQFDSLYQLARDTNFLVGGFMRYLGESDLKGRKYRTWGLHKLNDLPQKQTCKYRDSGLRTLDSGLQTAFGFSPCL